MRTPNTIRLVARDTRKRQILMARPQGGWATRQAEPRVLWTMLLYVGYCGLVMCGLFLTGWILALLFLA